MVREDLKIPPRAVELVAEHRHTLLNNEQRPRLERWLRFFPANTLAQEPELLLSQAWIAEVGRHDAHVVLAVVDRAQALVEQRAEPGERARQLQGEIDTLRSIEQSFAADDPQGVIMLATRALETMPRTWYLARVEARLELALGYLMSGQLNCAHATLAAAQGEEAAGGAAPRARLSAARCFIWRPACNPTPPRRRTSS